MNCAANSSCPRWAPSRWPVSPPPATAMPCPSFLEVLEQEAEDRRHRRINRLRRESKLPSGKTWETFEHHRMPLSLRQQLDHLAQGSFVEHGVNVLAFGLLGTGKTHALCALGHRLVEAGHSVLFAPAYRLVQSLLP